MQRDRMTAERDLEQQARAGELTMISARENADEGAGVWDGQDGQLIESGMDDESAEEMRRILQVADLEDDEIVSMEDAQITTRPSELARNDGPARIGPLGTPIDSEMMELQEDRIETAQADYTPVRPNLTVQRVDRVERTRVIRINSDLDPTIGQGPNSQWHFKKGRRYQVPEHVAFHLHEKGYVSSWG